MLIDVLGHSPHSSNGRQHWSWIHSRCMSTNKSHEELIFSCHHTSTYTFRKQIRNSHCKRSCGALQAHLRRVHYCSFPINTKRRIQHKLQHTSSHGPPIAEVHKPHQLYVFRSPGSPKAHFLQTSSWVDPAYFIELQVQECFRG